MIDYSKILFAGTGRGNPGFSGEKETVEAGVSAALRGQPRIARNPFPCCKTTTGAAANPARQPAMELNTLKIELVDQ